MCGIGGVWSKTTEDLLRIQIPMIESLETRGPDGLGAGLINLHEGTLARTRFIPDKEKDSRYNTHKKYEFYDETVTLGHSIMATAGFGQSKYTTRTHRQKTNRRELLRNMQPNHLYYHDLEEIVIRSSLSIHNGEIYDEPLLNIISPRSSNKATVDSRNLAEIFYQKFREFNNEWKAAEWVMKNVEGSFAFGFSNGQSLIFFKDRLGLRPLCIGQKNNNYVITSESGFLNEMNIDYIGEVKAGEMVKIDKKGFLESRNLIYGNEEPCGIHCGFDDNYLKRYYSLDFSGKVSCGNGLRVKTGIKLGQFYYNELKENNSIEIIIGYSPESGKSVAQGIAYALGLQYKDILWKTYPKLRYFLTRAGFKFNSDSREINGKNIEIGDDSLVRAFTTMGVYAELKRAGARKVKFVYGWPPIIHPCDLGIDMPTYEELFAHQLIKDKIIKVTQNGVEYDIHVVNREVTERLRKKIKSMQEYSDINPNDLEVYFATPEIVESVRNYKTCTQCYSGVNPFTGKSKFFDEKVRELYIK